MIYEFEDVETGERVSLEYPMARAPKIGAVVKRRGRRLRRLLSLSGTPIVNHYDNNLCWSLEPGAPGFDHYDPATGRGVISSRRVVDETCARNGVIWDK